MPYVNLENAESLLTVEQDPVKFLANHPNDVIIDEVHHFPKLFSYIQVAVDDDIYKGKTDRKFILTGSSNFTLLENVIQSLAGRTAVLNLLPLSLQELSQEERNQSADTLILNGGYPSIWSNRLPREKLWLSPKTMWVRSCSFDIQNGSLLIRNDPKILSLTITRQYAAFICFPCLCYFFNCPTSFRST